MDSYWKYKTVCGGHAFLFVLKTSKKRIWQLRLTLPGISASKFCLRKSLKTSSESQATRMAEDLFLEHRAKQYSDIPLGELNWSQLVDAYFQARAIDTNDAHRRTTDSYLNQFFSRFTSIRAIDDVAIQEFYRWRIDYWKENQHLLTPVGKGGPCRVAETPHWNTIKKSQDAITAILSFAHERGLITTLPHTKLPKALKKTLPSKPSRGGFDLISYKSLLGHIQHRCRKARLSSSRQGRRQERMGIERMRFLVLLIANSFIRPGEAWRLRNRHIFGEAGTDQFERQHHVIYTKIFIPEEAAKQARARTAISMDFHNTLQYFRRFQTIKQELGLPTGPNDYIFCSTRYPTRYQPMSAYFRKLLETFIGPNGRPLLYDGEGRMRSLYSLRSFAISQALTRGVPVAAVAKNAGTSIKMIDQTYFKQDAWNLRQLLVRNRYPESIPPNDRRFTILSNDEMSDLGFHNARIPYSL